MLTKNNFMQSVKIASLLLSLSYSSLVCASNEPPQQKDRSIETKAKDVVIARFISKLETSYIFPAKVKEFKQAINSFRATKEYQKISSSIVFAKKVNEILAEEIDDGHLFFGYSERELSEQESDETTKAMEKERELAFMRSLNWGIEKVQRFSFNIGYLDISMFADTKHAEETISAAMTLISNTEALIIDLRFSRGGDPETVALLASYFLEKATHLNDIYDRVEQKTTNIWSHESVKGQHYGEHRPLYILTSGDTYSAAEDFAYTLKHLKRAKIIGAVTGGGAHPGEFFRLANHFEAFIPTARSINAVTKSNWEGVGVIPNLKVESNAALIAAQTEILENMLKQEKEPRRKDRLRARIAKINAEEEK